MRTLDDALGFLASFTDWEQLLHRAPARGTFDLGRIDRLLERMGGPHQGRPVVHVTGTKGKSSTVMMADALLRAHGLRTFRFISPHVLDVTERLAIDGDPIDLATFVGLVSHIRPVVERIQAECPEDLPSFFEAIAVMGFLCAAQQDVDVLVLEVGLGGRLDATNVVDPTVSVVTSIALDHVRILGSTLEEIATEKAGILKPGRPAVTGVAPGHPAFDSIAERARLLACPLSHPGDGLELIACEEMVADDGTPRVVFSAAIGEVRFDDVVLAAGSRHQAVNAMCALAATEAVLRARGAAIDPQRARDALSRLRLPGRCQFVSGDPPVLLDGAHTRESVDDLVAVAKRVAGKRPVHLLCGMTRDRSPASVLASAVAVAASITATELDTPRSLSAADVVASIGPERDAKALPDAGQALERATAQARADGGIVLVVGSLYLAGAILRRLLPSDPWRPREIT